MKMLRAMRDSWGVLATVVSTRQDQLLSIPWSIQRRDKPKQSDKFVDQLKAFFKKPDGSRRYSQWARLILDDLLVLDAPCIFFSRDVGGRPISAERLDPLTIFPLIDDFGRTPESITEVSETGLKYFLRQPAYQQIIKGLPLVNLDASELMYVPMRPRADYPMFGYPPTEQIFIEAGEAIRKTLYQFNFWKEGTIPDLVVTVPNDWSPNQIAIFQAHFDAMLSGNLELKSKVRFLPGGMKPFDIKNSSGEALWSQRDETLIRLCCYAYSVSPAPFIQMMNRSTAQASQQASREEGTFPLMSFWKDDIMDPIIQEQFGYEDIEFVFRPPLEVDGEKQAKIHDIRLKNGSLNHNEVRAENGEEPVEGGDVFTIQIGNAIVPLKDAAAGKALPNQGGTEADGTGAASSSSVSAKPKSSSGSSSPQRGGARPAFGPSEVSKATKSDLREANRVSTGHLHAYSRAKLEAGNYKKGHIKVHGLDISIENAPGSIRGKKRPDGSVKWAVKMPVAYGYIKKTSGADGDQVDVYLGKKLDSEVVWIIDQNQVQNGEPIGFDEHKCFVGFGSLEKVLKTFLKTRKDGILALGPVSELSIEEFKTWLREGDTTAPVAGLIGKVVLEASIISKFDTISSATNLSTTSHLKSKKKKKKSVLIPVSSPFIGYN